jgi:outer membrane protein assembly factor BamD (BamD/ComL family)
MTQMRALPRWLPVLALTLFWVLPAFSDVFNQESFKTHLRWNLMLPKEQVTISKKDNVVTIETLNLPLFEQIAGEMTKMRRAEGYVENVAFSQEGFPAQPARAVVTLKDASVELFSFYRDVDRKWIMDFWVNADSLPSRAASLQKPLPLPAEEKEKKAVVQKTTKPIPLELKSPKKSLLEVVAVPVEQARQTNPEYRDFRYGAAFVWDYMPLLPPLERDVQLESKIPESFYAIKDRELLDDPKEAHLQLTINLYRQEKWGLMNKSLTLYQKKYGDDANFDTNEWLRLNALFRSNLTKKDKTLQATAMNLLGNLLERTTNYELKRGAFRYMIQYQIDRGDYFKGLELAKRFFVEARGQYDFDMVVLASNVILNSLARLRQEDKIAEFLSDKKLASLLPPQTELAYATYSLLAANKSAEVVKRFRLQEKNLIKPIHPAILYNTAEALFREAEYEEAARVYDMFISEWAHLREAAAARLRLALTYELLDRPASETVVLYKNAIDRSPYPEYRFEAKLRYVGMRIARKVAPDAADLETEVFLEQAVDEKKVVSTDMKKLLWLIRLRTFISRKAYDEALAYLASIPTDTLKPSERRVFDGDGAEIVFGVIQQAYLKEDYTRAVKMWEVYKDRFEKRVAGNPYMNFVIADSFIKLGLYQSFDRAYGVLRAMADEEPREYPLWIERTKNLPMKDMLEELGLIKSISSKEWDQAEAKLTSYPVSLRDSVNFSYYQGLVAYHRGQWSKAAEDFEKVLIKQNTQNRLTPRQMSELLMGYVESLYNLKDLERFKTVVKALAVDIQRSKSASILNVAERVNYLLIESLVGDSTPNWNEIEGLVRNFKGRFQKSPYSSRIEYLLGLSLLRNGKLDEGKATLRQLIERKEVPVYMREMARTELSALELKEKRL